MAKFDRVWRSLEQTVASGWAPGVVAGIRHRGETEFFATGIFGLDSPEPMRVTTPFRIASLSKPFSGALAALMIVEGTIGIDDPVDRWLPEMANPRVLVRPDSPLDQTVPAERPITVRHLLTMTNGMGVSFVETPLSRAIQEAGVGPNPIPPQMSADEFMARIGALPLAFQPGTRWTYHTGSDLLSVLLARAAGAPLRTVFQDRIADPLEMRSTGFSANGVTLPTPFLATGSGLTVFQPYIDIFAKCLPFETLSGGLISTVPDYMAFLAALPDGELLPRELQAAMTSDQLTREQRIGTDEMIGSCTSWGWQVSVETSVSEPWTAPGRYGWTGGAGTSAYVDPSRELIGVVFTQRFMSGPKENFAYFWGPLAEAIDAG